MRLPQLEIFGGKTHIIEIMFKKIPQTNSENRDAAAATRDFLKKHI